MRSSPSNRAIPYLQQIAYEHIESFVCRRCSSPSASADTKFDSGYHYHPEYELTFIEASHGRRYVGGSVEAYGPGDLLLVGPGVSHVYVRQQSKGEPEAASASSSIVLQFRPESLGEVLWLRPEMRPIRLLLDHALAGLHFSGPVVADIGRKMDELCTAKGARRILYLLDVLDRLSTAQGRQLCSRAKAYEPVAKDVDRIKRIIEFIEQRYGEEINLSDAARVVSLSPQAFSRFFSKATGKCFIRFLNELRVSHACQHLADTDKTVLEICFESGFSSLSNFNHRFQQLRGISPRDYRKQALGKKAAALAQATPAPWVNPSAHAGPLGRGGSTRRAPTIKRSPGKSLPGRTRKGRVGSV